MRIVFYTSLSQWEFLPHGKCGVALPPKESQLQQSRATHGKFGVAFPQEKPAATESRYPWQMWVFVKSDSLGKQRLAKREPGRPQRLLLLLPAITWRKGGHLILTGHAMLMRRWTILLKKIHLVPMGSFFPWEIRGRIPPRKASCNRVALPMGNSGSLSPQEKPASCNRVALPNPH